MSYDVDQAGKNIPRSKRRFRDGGRISISNQNKVRDLETRVMELISSFGSASHEPRLPGSNRKMHKNSNRFGRAEDHNHGDRFSLHGRSRCISVSSAQDRLQATIVSTTRKCDFPILNLLSRNIPTEEVSGIWSQ